MPNARTFNDPPIQLALPFGGIHSASLVPYITITRSLSRCASWLRRWSSRSCVRIDFAVALTTPRLSTTAPAFASSDAPNKRTRPRARNSTRLVFSGSVWVVNALAFASARVAIVVMTLPSA